MTGCIVDALEETFENPNSKWEWTKYKIREFCIGYTIRKNRERRALNTSLEKRLQELAEENDLTDSPDVVTEVKSIKRQLTEILQEKANKAIFKAKAHWIQLGERPSSYFLGLEKQQSKQKCITALKDDDGNTPTDRSEILAYQKKYFSEILQEDPSQLYPMEEMEEFIHPEEDLPQISRTHRDMINIPFTLQEFESALKDLNNNKSPGSDGITPELYRAFWNVLQQQFYESAIFSLEQGLLTQEQRPGILTLIPKKDQDRLSLNNWRPITLLNTDLEIISKAISNRIQLCIKDIVRPDQTGFIRGRTIGTNINNIQAVINQTKTSSSTGLLFVTDYRKAFDTIQWELIHFALKACRFGDYISSAVKMLFNKIRTCIFNSGFLSGYFYLTRGIRQGCCCSPSLFVIAVEVLAIAVKKSSTIQGNTVANQQVRSHSMQMTQPSSL